MVPVFEVQVDGQTLTVAAENRDYSLTTRDIGRVMVVTYQPSNKVLLGYDIDVKDPERERVAKRNLVLAIVLLIVIVVVGLLVFHFRQV